MSLSLTEMFEHLKKIRDENYQIYCRWKPKLVFLSMSMEFFEQKIVKTFRKQKFKVYVDRETMHPPLDGRVEMTIFCLISQNAAKIAFLTTSFPGSSLYLEKVPWLRLVTCLLDFSRFQRCDWRDRGWKFQVCLHWAHLLSPVGSEICNLPILDRQNSQRGHWHIQYWSSMHSMLS